MSYSDAVSSSAKAAAPRKGFKLVLLGDASVGKSSILLRFLHNKFSEEIATTVGAAFNTKTIESKGRQVKFEIWDTAGQERFRSLAPMYYRGASAAIVVYDQTNAVTFDRAQEWVREVMSTSTNPNIVIALAANKADMESKQQVPWEKAERFAQQQGLFLLDTSAMTGKNVLRLFEGIAELLPDEPFMPQQRGLQVLTTPTTTNATAATDQKASARSRCC
ncbi:RAB5C [Symbiodinium necroappetens]|uniref:RAB5C protein n=1 Tax=Symbiodinium necroappetens TaxID=1628268 RepID=A0A812XIB3_9DINO|nr:RAB5C [Symbiodinium necroappetens]|mmetsp:Transcript_126457/g.300299  ORF Transcript_126457/g.300299 Transcript_126457/m.300299 type:complete len:220 (+) Transcript_126457:51-710(+)